MNLTENQSLSPVHLARTAGILYLLIIICGLFSEVYVRSSLIVQGDAALTANNIITNELLFRIGFISDMTMLLCDLAIAIIFYVLLKPVSHTLALGAAFLRLIMDAILAVNLLNHFSSLLLLSGDNYLSAFDENQINSLIYLSLESHSIGYAIGLTFFAFHCLLLGYLIYRSDYFPKIIGAMLSIASISYLTDSVATFLFAGYETENYAIIMLPALLAELSLCLWLLFIGVKQSQKPNQAIESTSSNFIPANKS